MSSKNQQLFEPLADRRYIITYTFVDSILVSGRQPQSRRPGGWWERVIPTLRLRRPPSLDDEKRHLL